MLYTKPTASARRASAPRRASWAARAVVRAAFTHRARNAWRQRLRFDRNDLRVRLSRARQHLAHPPVKQANLGQAKIMKRAIAAKPKKRGRPATGRDLMIGLRASPRLRKSIEEWAGRQTDGPSLSEAIRRLVELRLTVRGVSKPSTAVRHARRGKADQASSMAGTAIDKLSDQSATTEEQAKRKRRLVRGPSEFRDIRDRTIRKRDA